jgi:hypothetical protein
MVVALDGIHSQQAQHNLTTSGRRGRSSPSLKGRVAEWVRCYGKVSLVASLLFGATSAVLLVASPEPRATTFTGLAAHHFGSALESQMRTLREHLGEDGRHCLALQSSGDVVDCLRNTCQDGTTRACSVDYLGYRTEGGQLVPGHRNRMQFRACQITSEEICSSETVREIPKARLRGSKDKAVGDEKTPKKVQLHVPCKRLDADLTVEQDKTLLRECEYRKCVSEQMTTCSTTKLLSYDIQEDFLSVAERSREFLESCQKRARRYCAEFAARVADGVASAAADALNLL